jgi:hypothetical protein
MVKLMGENQVGLARFDQHTVELVGIGCPMPQAVVELCVQPAHYKQDLKAAARAHRSHALLYYEGRESDPLDQYVALAVVGGVLAEHGAIVVLNESAHTSFPANALAAQGGGEDMLELLRTLPLLILYCGFVKYDQEGVPKVWMRSFGNHLFGLPDLAYLAEGHHQGQWVFDLFCNVLAYLRNTGARLAPRHTSQVGDNIFVRFRSPRKEESFLDSEGEMLVLEQIGAGEVNRWVVEGGKLWGWR